MMVITRGKPTIDVDTDARVRRHWKIEDSYCRVKVVIGKKKEKE